MVGSTFIATGKNHYFLWVKPCHKPPIFVGNGLYIPPIKMGDDWGIMIVLATFFDLLWDDLIHSEILVFFSNNMWQWVKTLYPCSSHQNSW